MDTQNYLNLLQNRDLGEQVSQQRKEVEAQIKTQIDDTVSGLGLPFSYSVLSDNLGSDGFKSYLKGKLANTGDADVDSEISNIIDNIDSPIKNSSQIFKSLLRIGKLKGNKVIDQVQSGELEPADIIGGIQDAIQGKPPASDGSMTFKNPIFDAGDSDNLPPMLEDVGEPSLFENLTGKLASAKQAITDGVNNVRNTISSKIQDLPQSLDDVGELMGKSSTINGLRSNIPNFDEIFSSVNVQNPSMVDLPAKFASMTPQQTQDFMDVVNGRVSSAQSLTDDLYNTASQFRQTALNRVVSQMPSELERIPASTSQNIGDLLNGKLPSMPNADIEMPNIQKLLPDTEESPLSDLAGNLTSKITDIGENIASTAGDALAGATDALGGVADAIGATGATEAIGGVLDAIPGLEPLGALLGLLGIGGSLGGIFGHHSSFNTTAPAVVLNRGL
jgi:hypothetical protein